MAGTSPRSQDEIARDGNSAPRWRSELKLLPAWFALLLALTFSLQWFGGAYQSELGGHPDEAAHYVTGLMMRDYIASGLGSHPLDYAQNYYDHYPKVALGNWPPFFYMLQSGWTLLFSPSRGSVLFLMAVLTALAATTLFRVARREFGTGKAVFIASAFVMLPLVQEHAHRVMTEIPVALLALLAAICFGRFLERGRTGDSILFGIFASLAILTKGSGIMLALVPPLAVVLTRQFAVLKKAAFWYPAIIVAVLCGPWTYAFRETARAGWHGDGVSLEFTKNALAYYPAKLFGALGVLLLVIAALGVARQFQALPGRKMTGTWAAALGLFVAVFVVHWTVPVGFEPRHLLPAIAPLLLFVASGMASLQQSALQMGIPARFASVPAFVLAGGALIALFELPVKGYAGFEKPAQLLVARASGEPLLISSDARGEGQFIAEVAMREKRPGHVVKRASKVLATARWSGGDYELRYRNAGEVAEVLEREAVGFIVIDTSVPKHRRVAHHELLREAIETHPERFDLVYQGPNRRGGEEFSGAIRVYERRRGR